jgi:hypothetical protein
LKSLIREILSGTIGRALDLDSRFGNLELEIQWEQARLNELMFRFSQQLQRSGEDSADQRAFAAPDCG